MRRFVAVFASASRRRRPTPRRSRGSRRSSSRAPRGRPRARPEPRAGLARRRRDLATPPEQAPPRRTARARRGGVAPRDASSSALTPRSRCRGSRRARPFSNPFLMSAANASPRLPRRRAERLHRAVPRRGARRAAHRSYSAFCPQLFARFPGRPEIPAAASHAFSASASRPDAANGGSVSAGSAGAPPPRRDGPRTGRSPARASPSRASAQSKHARFARPTNPSPCSRVRAGAGGREVPEPKRRKG